MSAHDEMVAAVAEAIAESVHNSARIEDWAEAAVRVFEDTGRELEYGWEWASNPYIEPYVIHGSDSKESAERAMRDTEIKVAPVRIMVREKAAAGPWREA